MLSACVPSPKNNNKKKAEDQLNTVNTNNNFKATEPIANFIIPSATVIENQGLYNVAVVLNKPSASDVSISFIVVGQDMIMGSDAIVSGSSVYIQKGKTVGLIPVSIINDSNPESMESMSIILTNNQGADLGNQTSFLLSIQDDDQARVDFPPPLPTPVIVNPTPIVPTPIPSQPGEKAKVNFQLDSISIPENIGVYNIGIMLEKPATENTIITYVVSPISLSLGTDIIISNGSVNIPMGQQFASISATIVNDTLMEATESLTIILASFIGSNPGSKISFQLNIIDDDNPLVPTPLPPLNPVNPAIANFQLASINVSEDSVVYNAAVLLDKPASENTTINFSLTSLGIILNSDVSIIGNSVSIAQGSQVALIPITIINDTTEENSESIVIQLTSAQGSILGPMNSFQLTIDANDKVDVVDPNITAFTATLYNNILRNPDTGRCFNCHRSNGPVRQQQPFHSNDDPELALNTLNSFQLVDLDDPQASAIVTKIARGHQTWTGNPTNDSQAVLAQIVAWAAMVNSIPNIPAPAGLQSLTLKLSDGVEDVSSARFVEKQIALWDFKEGSGQTILDRSGITPALDLDITGDVTWLSGQGIECGKNENGGKAQGNSVASRKIYDRISATNSYTVEAWVRSATPDQDGPTRIVSYSSGTSNRNFTLGQQGVYYNFRNRNAQTGNNGSQPSYEPQIAKISDRTGVQHVVATYDGFRRRLYVDGQEIVDDGDAAEQNTVQALGNQWNSQYNLAFCNETTSNRSFKGQIYLVAIHNGALTLQQVANNFDSGLNAKLKLSFDISSLSNANAKLEVNAIVVDSKTYAFYDPKFIGLSTPIKVEDIRVAVNDQVGVSSQSWSIVNQLSAANNQLLSGSATLANSQMGPDDDQISIVFGTLGNATSFQARQLMPFEGQNTNVSDVVMPNSSATKNFLEISQSLSNITGVPLINANVLASYNELRDGLPTNGSIEAFSTANQINISKLAYEFCSEMVASDTLRNNFFGGNIDLNANSASVFNLAIKNQISDAIIEKAIGANISNQPNSGEVKIEVHGMIDDLIPSSNVSNILKASCLLGTSSMSNLLK
jgi:hypothetical protein